MSDKDSRFVGCGSSFPDPHPTLRAFARVVRPGVERSEEEIEEQEFIRIELAVAWVQFQIGTFRAVRGEAFLRDHQGRVLKRIALPSDDDPEGEY